MIYLDNAATSGIKPQGIINSVNKALSLYNANPGRSGYNRSVKAAEKVYETRVKVAEYFCAEPENVAFTLNCTQAINYILKGILSSGDHVIVSDLEHNAVMRPLFELTNKKGVEVSIAKVENTDEQTIKNFENLIKSNTKLIFCTHASNVTGEILPIKKIGKLAKIRGIDFAVDAAQSAGVLPINMEEMNIDYLAIAPHKGLYSPMGTGILIAKKPLPFTVIEGGTGSNSLEIEQPSDMPERMESGTVNLPGIFGINAGLDFVKNHKNNEIYIKEMHLIRYIHSHLKNIEGVKLYLENYEDFKKVPLLIFNYKDYKSEEISNYLGKKGIATRGGLHCAPSAHKKLGTLPFGCVRISAGCFNSINEAQFLIKTVKNIKKF